MTDLTEQWKKGKLPDGWYYVQLKEGVYADNVKSIIMDYYTEFSDFMKHPYLIEQVLAPVPTFDEWDALIDLYKEADVIIKKSDKKNTKLKTDCKTLAQKLLQVKPELREWLEINFKEFKE